MSRPQFFIVGAPKAGTSSMASYLRQHPQLFLPDLKDVPFFGTDLSYLPARPSSTEYLALFSVSQPEQLTGDACVSYLQSRRAAEEIKAYQSNARIVIMLRDPVAAMHSMHSHLRYLHEEDIEDFGEALEAEADRASGLRVPPGVRLVDALLYRDVFAYHDQVQRFLECFGPDRVLILLFDDLKRDAAKVVRATYEFLHVDPSFVPDLSIENPNKSVRLEWLQRLTMNPPPRFLRAFTRIAPRRLHGRVIPFLTHFNTKVSQRPPTEPTLDSMLRAEASPDIYRLSMLIDRDLSAWMAPGFREQDGEDLAQTPAHRLK
ncbi:MAG TPA: sulfotransferase [Solirubrobacterales bacterium]|nr:sulfotransferase [Solirubrobacterales bacterium]